MFMKHLMGVALVLLLAINTSLAGDVTL
ncbi:hypothetical protein A259_28094, partial [Pseudomonas syringae pv. actinidiae ICMP 19070]